MKKRILLLLAAILLIFTVSCCHRPVMEVLSSGTTYSSYSRFNGTKSFAMIVGEKPVSVDIKSTSGVLHVEVAKNGDAPIYTGNISEDFSFRLNAEPGRYKVTLKGDKHAGSYRFTW